MNNQICIIGSIFGTSGYDNHTRQLFNALYKLYPNIKLEVPKVENWVRYVNDAELDALTKKSEKNDIVIAISTPPFWKLYLASKPKYFIGFCVWEGDKIPESWLNDILDERIDMIFVPSQHTKDAIINTYYNEDIPEIMLEQDKKFINKIKIIPHGVDFDIFNYKKPEKQNELFTFIFNGGWRGTDWDRKGCQYLLKAFSEEFKKEEKVKLICKLNPSYINYDILKKNLERLNIPKDAGLISFSCDNVDYKSLLNFYRTGDCYVCATRAEGFDLGTAEAMACGLPIITTGYGGQIEHMNNDCALFIKYKLDEVKEDLMYEGIKWATPDIIDLRKKLRWMFENRGKVKEMGLKSREFISTWTWENTAKKVLDEIKIFI
jgi:glycosyltransferase involved in cell wall biosynthesis